MKGLSVTIGVAAIALSTTFAQIVIDTTNPIQFGIYAHGMLTYHRTGAFSQLGSIAKPAVPFSDAWGDGISFGALLNSLLSSIIEANQLTAAIHLGLRVGFALQSVILDAVESHRFLIAGLPQQGQIIHTIKASLASFGGEGTIEFTPPFHENIRLHAGARLAWVYTAAFRQTERISIAGANPVFVGGDAVRRTIEGDIPTARNYEMYGMVGVSYNVPIEKRFAVVPEVFAAIPMTTHTADLPWKSWWLKAGISVKVTLPTTKPLVRDTLIERDTTVKVLPGTVRDTTVLLSVTYRTVINETEEVRYEYVHCRQLYERRLPPKAEVVPATIQLRIFERLSDSSIVELDTFYCREMVWTDFHPLLPYIFFDFGSRDLSLRYVQLTRTAAESYLPQVNLEQMNTYYSLLNIIGYGLRNNPAARLRIKGCVSRRERDRLSRWQVLARERAETVAQYLYQTWGINPSQIEILPVGLPTKPSNERSEDGVAENQRVELYSSDEHLLQHVMIRDTVLESRTAHIRLVPSIITPTPILRWNVELSHAGRILYKNGGEGECPAMLDVELHADRMRRLARSDTAPLMVRVRVEQQGKGLIETQRTIPLSIETLEQLRARDQATEVDRYILMLFDAGKAEPPRAGRSIIAHVRRRIQPGSTVSVIGSTDRTGSLRYNMELSLRRAKAVAALLSYPVAMVKGIGPDTVNYDNDRPEGRFHARTVKIEVEHPRPSRVYLSKPEHSR